MNSIDVKQLQRLIPNIKLIDIRDNYQYNLGTITTSVNIPMSFLLMNPENYLNKNDTYYIFCEYGSSSKRACMRLSNDGYQVVDVLGGFSEYKRHKSNY